MAVGPLAAGPIAYLAGDRSVHVVDIKGSEPTTGNALVRHPDRQPGGRLLHHLPAF